MVDTTSVRNPSSVSLTPNTSVKARSDGGTIFLHWTTAISMVASLLTGLRISADGIHTSWAQAISPILPSGEMWTWHILAGLLLFFCTIAYFVYLNRAALGGRNSSTRLRTIRPPTTSKLRWRAINVALHWFAYAAITILTVTGVALYLGFSDLFVTVHRALAWAMLFYIVVHTITHFLYGGLEQLLRVFRPQALQAYSSSGSWPVAIAVSCGLVFAVAAYALDETTKPILSISKVQTDPTLDGILDEAIWQGTKSITINTHQGANLGETGSSQVTVRAVRTEQDIHFAFRWWDPTLSLMRSPTIKRGDGWYVMSTNAAIADVNDFYEDKFSVLFSHNDALGGGGSTFLGDKPLSAFPKSPHGRGLHYTDDGRILDLWQWKSSRGGMLGHVDDMHFGPPKIPSAKEASGKKRYAAGYASDPGKAIYEYNYIADGKNGYNSPVTLKRLPKNLASTVTELGNIPDSADGSNDPESIWWMAPETSVPYSEDLDRRIPNGTILPSTLNIHSYKGDRADLRGGAKWKDGYWTLEVSRKLTTGSPYDLDFHPGTQIFLWASVFDHNQTRHTRHQRPIILNIQ